MTDITKKEVEKFNLRFEVGKFMLQEGKNISIFQSNKNEVIENYIILNLSVDKMKSFFSNFTRDINRSSNSDNNCILEAGKPSGLAGKGYQIKKHQEKAFVKALNNLYKKGLVIVIDDKFGIESVPARLSKPKNN